MCASIEQESLHSKCKGNRRVAVLIKRENAADRAALEQKTTWGMTKLTKQIIP